MIAALAKLLGVDKWLVSVVAIVIAAGLVLWAANSAYSRIYDSGYQAAAVKYEAQIAAEHAAAVTAALAETERQDAANNAAKAREAARIAEIEAENQSLEDKIKELQREASEDPDAGRTAISAPGVRRVNTVR